MSPVRALAAVAVVVVAVACSGSDAVPTPSPEPSSGGTEATEATEAIVGPTPSAGTTTPTSVGSDGTAPAPTPGASVPDGALAIAVDATRVGAPISPRIVGVSGDLDRTQMAEIGVRVNSWGGNPASRFNYEIGHAWNNGSDWEFRNTNYGNTGDAAREFIAESQAADAAVRLAVPALGWVARDDSTDTCSFPDDAGGCAGGAGLNCESPGTVADPERANVATTSAAVAQWVADLDAEGLAPTYVAIDNEPELWGYTHYDVHPACPTYEEILATYLDYASAIRETAPDALLTGPVMCCWYDYWRTAPGPADGSGEDFLGWFLRKVREHDEEAGVRTLDLVDVHYYPQGDVFNDATDEETSARRLRSTRSLWDRDYIDESWIDDRIAFLPRLREIIDATYPDTPIIVSEWNFGADATMNGALAIADVLGIYGREGVEAATYWRSPEPGSPGYLAFRMHGNYDGAGGRFGGSVVGATTPDVDLVSAFAALDDDTGVLKLMLINKQPEAAAEVVLDVAGFDAAAAARRWTVAADAPGDIVAGDADVSGVVTLPASSITVLELVPA